MRKLVCYIFLLFLTPVLALAVPPVGIGNVAQNMLEPVGLLNDFVNMACFIFGGSFLFASIIKYVEHRRSPLMVPISTVVYLVLAGLFLIILPFAYMVTENGMHFSLWR
jgi:hypothetical protein